MEKERMGKADYEIFSLPPLPASGEGGEGGEATPRAGEVAGGRRGRLPEWMGRLSEREGEVPFPGFLGRILPKEIILSGPIMVIMNHYSLIVRS